MYKSLWGQRRRRTSIQVASVWPRAALIKHVVVVFLLHVRLVEVLHFLFGTAWPVAGRSAQATHGVAVVLVVWRRFLRLLQRRRQSTIIYLNGWRGGVHPGQIMQLNIFPHLPSRLCSFLHGAVLVFRARVLPLPPSAFTCNKLPDAHKPRWFHHYLCLRNPCMCAVPLRAGAGFLDPVSESESHMDLSGFFAFGAGGFLGLGTGSDSFLAATENKFKTPSLMHIMKHLCHKETPLHTLLRCTADGHSGLLSAARADLSLLVKLCRMRSCWSTWRTPGCRHCRCQTWLHLQEKHKPVFSWCCITERSAPWIVPFSDQIQDCLWEKEADLQLLKYLDRPSNESALSSPWFQTVFHCYWIIVYLMCRLWTSTCQHFTFRDTSVCFLITQIVCFNMQRFKVSLTTTV